MVRRPNLHKERISGGDDLFQWGLGRGVLEVQAPVGDEAFILGCVRCGGWCVWTRSLTRPVSWTVRRSMGDSAGAPGLSRVDADTAPSVSEDGTPGSRGCVRVLALLGWVGRAGLPGVFWCASPFHFAALACCFPWPLRSLCFCFFLVRAPFVSCFLVSGPGCLGPWRCALRFFFLPASRLPVRSRLFFFPAWPDFTSF